MPATPDRTIRAWLWQSQTSTRSSPSTANSGGGVRTTQPPFPGIQAVRDGAVVPVQVLSISAQLTGSVSTLLNDRLPGASREAVRLSGWHATARIAA